jgi:hypothetical protein
MGSSGILPTLSPTPPERPAALERTDLATGIVDRIGAAFT